MSDNPYLTVLDNYGWLADLYMIDYVVECQWEILPASWRNYFSQLIELSECDRSKVRDIMKFILCAPCEYDSIDPNLLCKIRRIPVPLSFLALKKCILSLSAHSFANVTCPKDFSKYIQFKGIAPELKFTSLQEILPSALRLKIKEKKSHEISRLYDFIRLLVGYIGASYKVDEIVDIGAGLGHLSRILSLLFNFKVTTIEGNEQLVNRSNKIDFTTEVSLNHKARNHEKNDVMNNFPTEWQKPERKAAFIQHENEILQSTGSKQLLVGLHTCGDFAAIILRHFISNPEAKILINLGCCYHKLNGGLDKLYRNVYDDVQAPTSHHGFPLSRKFRHFKLSYAARELACFGREQFLKRLDDSISQEAFFVNCYRAILEWIILGCPSSLNSPQNFDPILRHQGLRGVRGAERLTFWEYAEETLKEKPALRKHFNDMCESRPELKTEVLRIIETESTKLLLLYTLRLMVAPLIENVILMDRQEFLRENGCSAYLVPVFDSRISPRNIALVSWKST